MLYVGTQLAASAVTAISADPTQRRIMFALPFVFVIFIFNFPAGLIVYWITTNVWTIGQQLAVKKLYPKPVPATAGGDGGRRRQARAREAAESAAAATAAAAAGERPPSEERGKAKAAAAASDGDGAEGAAARRRARRRSARGAGVELARRAVAEGSGRDARRGEVGRDEGARVALPGLSRRITCGSRCTQEDGADGPAQVRAEVDEEAWRTAAGTIPEEPAERVRAIVARVVHALGLHARSTSRRPTRRSARRSTATTSAS